MAFLACFFLFFSCLVLFIFTGGLQKTKLFATIPRVEMAAYKFLNEWCVYIPLEGQEESVSGNPKNRRGSEAWWKTAGSCLVGLVLFVCFCCVLFACLLCLVVFCFVLLVLVCRFLCCALLFVLLCFVFRCLFCFVWVGLVSRFSLLCFVCDLVLLCFVLCGCV